MYGFLETLARATGSGGGCLFGFQVGRRTVAACRFPQRVFGIVGALLLFGARDLFACGLEILSGAGGGSRNGILVGDGIEPQSGNESLVRNARPDPAGIFTFHSCLFSGSD